ncbi:MAG: transglutaminase domain-containing protein [Lachnospiraceae bacterium]|nr:transglutaminase domain-containing protein [Lachnospiraceae bacterium]
MLNLFRRKKRVREEWDGIYVSDASLGIQTESRVWTLLWKALIVFCMVGGGMGCMLSAIEVDYHPLIVEIVTLLTALFLASLYYQKIWENAGYLMFFVIMALLGFGMQNYINSGFYSVMNDLMEEASEYFESNAMRSYGERVGNTGLAVTVSMCYIGAVVCLIVNILISRRMRYFLVLLAAGGVLFFPLYMELEPEPLFVIQLFTGLFLASGVAGGGHYSLEKDNSRYHRKKQKISYVYAHRTVLQAGACVLGFTILVSVLLSVITPADSYHERHPDGAWKKSTMDTVENLSALGIMGLFNFYSNTGGLTSGRLGGVSAVRLDYETDLQLTFVPYNQERFYLRQFIGQNYIYRANHWEAPEYVHNTTEMAAMDAYFDKEQTSGRGVVKVDNVAAEPGVYLPYYSLDDDKYLIQGRSQEYTYYVSGDDFASHHVPDEYVEDGWLEIPEENLATLDSFCKEAELSGEPEEIVQKLAAYYQKEIPYSYQPGLTPYGQDFVNYFLDKNRRGYCAHFASAATLLFRYMGIPARYVEGYAVDPEDIGEEGEVLLDEKVTDYYNGYKELEETGVVKVNVTDANAHAWVEIYLKDRGWQVVDITPASDQESSGASIWNMFMRLFRGGNGNQTAELEDADADSATADAIDAVKRTGRISFGVIGFIIVLFVVVVVVKYLYRTIRFHWLYNNSNLNDKLIFDYQKYVRKIGHNEPGFHKERNYKDQTNWLRKKQKLQISGREAEHFVQILEQAGFSSTEISGEDADWVREVLRRR